MHTSNAEIDLNLSWDGTLMSRMGIRVVSATAQLTILEMPVVGNTQPHGLLHGGASAVLAETAASHAAQLHACTFSDQAVAVGVELNISHLTPGRGQNVHAIAVADHLGKTSTVHTVTITDEDDHVLAVARVSNRILHS